jgi:DNA-binding transcriptional LysR family regulator
MHRDLMGWTIEHTPGLLRLPPCSPGTTPLLTRKHLDHWDIDGESVRVSWRINTGNAAVTRNAVRARLGIARVPEFFVAQDLADGALVRLLPHYDLPTYPVVAVYPRSTVPSLALRTLLDDLPRWCG